MIRKFRAVVQSKEPPQDHDVLWLNCFHNGEWVPVGGIGGGSIDSTAIRALQEALAKHIEEFTEFTTVNSSDNIIDNWKDAKDFLAGFTQEKTLKEIIDEVKTAVPTGFPEQIVTGIVQGSERTDEGFPVQLSGTNLNTGEQFIDSIVIPNEIPEDRQYLVDGRVYDNCSYWINSIEREQNETNDNWRSMSLDDLKIDHFTVYSHLSYFNPEGASVEPNIADIEPLIKRLKVGNTIVVSQFSGQQYRYITGTVVQKGGILSYSDNQDYPVIKDNGGDRIVIDFISQNKRLTIDTTTATEVFEWSSLISQEEGPSYPAYLGVGNTVIADNISSSDTLSWDASVKGYKGTLSRTAGYKYVWFAHRSVLPELTDIISNGINIIDSFTVQNLTVNGESHRVYVMKNPGAVSNLSIIFK